MFYLFNFNDKVTKPSSALLKYSILFFLTRGVNFDPFTLNGLDWVVFDPKLVNRLNGKKIMKTGTCQSQTL